MFSSSVLPGSDSGQAQDPGRMFPWLERRCLDAYGCFVLLVTVQNLVAPYRSCGLQRPRRVGGLIISTNRAGLCSPATESTLRERFPDNRSFANLLNQNGASLQDLNNRHLKA